MTASQLSERIDRLAAPAGEIPLFVHSVEELETWYAAIAKRPVQKGGRNAKSATEEELDEWFRALRAKYPEPIVILYDDGGGPNEI